MTAKLTEQERRLRTIPEAEWQRNVERMLTTTGWLWYHSPDNRPTRAGYIQNVKAGFPDIIAVRGTRMIFVELKRQTGRRSPEQVVWAEALQAAGQEYYLWRPGDTLEASKVLAPGWAA